MLTIPQLGGESHCYLKEEAKWAWRGLHVPQLQWHTIIMHIGAVANLCKLEPDHGPCDGNFTRWHYDAERGHCRKFKYGGCGGNDNQFLRKAQCMWACNPPTSVGMCMNRSSKHIQNKIITTVCWYEETGVLVQSKSWQIVYAFIGCAHIGT